MNNMFHNKLGDVPEW